jgi:hypothetical protein
MINVDSKLKQIPNIFGQRSSALTDEPFGLEAHDRLAV